MKPAAEALGDGPGGPGAEERIEDDVPGLGRGEQDAGDQRLGLLRRMDLAARLVLQALLAGAQRDEPVRADLDILVAGLESLVVEGVAGLGVARGPDQRLMGIGEPAAAKVRHRVRLAPDDVVQHPESEVLQRRADAEDVVVGADHPERAVRFQHAARGGEPGSREGVVGSKALELVPVVVDGVDAAVVGAVQFAL